MTELTIFTAPKPFVNPHVVVIQRNAVKSWQQLGEGVEIFLVGDEEGIGATAQELGVEHVPVVERNASGTPLIRSIFEEVRKRSSSPLLVYVNADVILLPDFVEHARRIASQARKFLVVGQRWDLPIVEEIDFSPGWDEQLRDWIRREGHLHVPYGSDYFIFPQECYKSIPDFAVGRAGWDNWMLYHARYKGWQLINATGTIEIVHQRHDYSHLPGSQPHYRHPESDENIRIAGGRRAIFSLADTNYCIERGRIRRQKLSLPRLLREIEIFPMVTLHFSLLGQLFFAIFHPRKAYGEFRAWLKQRQAKS